MLSNAKAHWLGLVGYKTRGPADVKRSLEQSFLDRDNGQSFGSTYMT